MQIRLHHGFFFSTEEETTLRTNHKIRRHMITDGIIVMRDKKTQEEYKNAKSIEGRPPCDYSRIIAVF